MPVGLDNALQIAKSSLFLNQYKINVIGQNIANADNENYSKKVVVTETNSPIKEISPGTIGTGVNIKEINRMIDKFLEMSIINNQSYLGEYEISSKYLRNIESIFNDLNNNGLGDRLNEFWNAWYDLSNNPSKAPERIAVIKKAQNLSEFFKYINNELEEQNKLINRDIDNIVNKINELSEEIAKLNEEIYKIEVNPQNHANDLRDKRDTLVKELSKYIDIRYVEEGNNYVIFTANGKTLVNGKFSYTLKTTFSENNSTKSKILWQGKNGDLEDITESIKGGELKGLIDVRDYYLEDYKNEFNHLANTIITEVNKLHSSGVGLKAYKEIMSNVRVNNSDLSFNFEGLSNSVNKGKFSIIIYDSYGNPVEYKDIVIGDPESTNPIIDADVNNLLELKDQLNSISHLNAEIINNKLRITSDEGYTFVFSNDTSGVLSGLGINTFFNDEKYDLTPNINLVTTEETSNSDHLYNVSVYNESIITNHEYEIQYNSGALTIKDLTIGKTLTNEDYRTSVINGHLTIEFDGIRIQLDNSTWTGNNIYHVKNIASVSVYDDNLIDNHSYQINFTQGDDFISISDLTEQRTLNSNEFDIIDIDINNDSVVDYKAIKIKKNGLTITIDNNSYGVVKIKPKNVGAKFINTILDVDDYSHLNAGKVNSINIDDSQSTIKVHNIEITDFSALTRQKYTITSLGSGNYRILNEEGEEVSPTSQGANFVEINGIMIRFENNTINGEIYYLDSNKLDYSAGDNRIALNIADLKDKKVINDSESITENYSNLLTKIGLDLNNLNNRLDSIKINRNALIKQRDSVSGVSIDEEMTKLIQTQHAYIASSKLITIIDKLTEHLINTI